MYRKQEIQFFPPLQKIKKKMMNSVKDERSKFTGSREWKFWELEAQPRISGGWDGLKPGGLIADLEKRLPLPCHLHTFVVPEVERNFLPVCLNQGFWIEDTKKT